MSHPIVADLCLPRPAIFPFPMGIVASGISQALASRRIMLAGSAVPEPP